MIKKPGARTLKEASRFTRDTTNDGHKRYAHDEDTDNFLMVVEAICQYNGNDVLRVQQNFGAWLRLERCGQKNGLCIQDFARQ